MTDRITGLEKRQDRGEKPSGPFKLFGCVIFPVLHFQRLPERQRKSTVVIKFQPAAAIIRTSRRSSSIVISQSTSQSTPVTCTTLCSTAQCVCVIHNGLSAQLGQPRVQMQKAHHHHYHHQRICTTTSCRHQPTC